LIDGTGSSGRRTRPTPETLHHVLGPKPFSFGTCAAERLVPRGPMDFDSRHFCRTRFSSNTRFAFKSRLKEQKRLAKFLRVFNVRGNSRYRLFFQSAGSLPLLTSDMPTVPCRQVNLNEAQIPIDSSSIPKRLTFGHFCTADKMMMSRCDPLPKTMGHPQRRFGCKVCTIR
jgi:hypothetical protein